MKSIVWQFYKKLLLICTSAPLIFVTSSRSICENTGLYYKHKKKMCSKFTGEYLCQSMISIKLLRNFAEIAIRYRCSPGNLLHIFRTFFYKDNYGGLLLNKAIIKMFQVLCVCLCVCVCVYVCVCVCVYILLPWMLLPSARCLRHTWGVRINDLVLLILFWVLLLSFFISVSKSVIFYLQRRNSRSPKTGEKTKLYIRARWKMM